MDPRQQRAAIAFVATIAGLALLQKIAAREAAVLGIPEVAIAGLVAVVAHELA